MTKVSQGINIAILDRGFVYVGEVSTDENWVYIDKAKNIRRWGTTGGLGELAESGPLPNTKLDAVNTGAVKTPLRALIALIPCESAKWTL